MTWVRLDDGFPDHPKVQQAGGDAAWLYVCGLAYSARYLTDGAIPAEAIARLSDRADPRALAERLVAVGLWERRASGYLIHDFGEYNPPADSVRARRDAAAERMRTVRSQPVRANDERTNGEHFANNERSSRNVRAKFANPVPGPGPIPGNTPAGDEDDVARARASGAAAPTIATTDDDEGSNLADAMDPSTVDAARAVWQPVSERLRGEMHARNHAAYIASCVPLGIADDGALLLSTANPLLLEQAGRFREQMKRALADIPDGPRDVRLVAAP